MIYELKQKRSQIVDSMQLILTKAHSEQRNRNEEEIKDFEEKEAELKAIDDEIEAIEKVETENKRQLQTNVKELTNVKNEKTNEKRMNIYSQLKEKRNGDNFAFTIESRAIDTTTGLYSETLFNEIYSNGEKPLFDLIGIKKLSNLEGNVKLPKVQGMYAGKVAPGTAANNDKVISFVDIIPNESFRLSETISMDMAKNDVLVSGIIAELIKGVDRKISQEIFTVALASATAQAGITALTVANTFALENVLDVEYGSYLVSKEAFATGRLLSVEAGDSTKLFKKVAQNQAETFEGTPVFFSGAIAKQVIYGDMSSLVLGDWGQIEVGYELKPSLGQVIITVSKKAAVVYRGVNSLVKTIIA